MQAAAAQQRVEALEREKEELMHDVHILQQHQSAAADERVSAAEHEVQALQAKLAKSEQLLASARATASNKLTAEHQRCQAAARKAAAQLELVRSERTDALQQQRAKYEAELAEVRSCRRCVCGAALCHVCTQDMPAILRYSMYLQLHCKSYCLGSRVSAACRHSRMRALSRLSWHQRKPLCCKHARSMHSRQAQQRRQAEQRGREQATSRARNAWQHRTGRSAVSRGGSR